MGGKHARGNAIRAKSMADHFDDPSPFYALEVHIETRLLYHCFVNLSILLVLLSSSRLLVDAPVLQLNLCAAAGLKEARIVCNMCGGSAPL